MSTTAKVALLAFFTLFATSRARAQIEGLAEWADYVATASSPHWVGQRVPWPTHTPRPDAWPVAASEENPWRLHASSAVSDGAVERATRALDHAAVLARVSGWGAPAADGGDGGSSAFDVYFGEPGGGLCETYVDRRVLASVLDSATSFAVVDPDLDEDALRVCLARAYAEAVLDALDPAEAPALRRAIATFLAWQMTGLWAEDTRGATGPGSARWWAMVSAQLDGGDGRAVHELVHFARQRTWDGVELRGAPDLWMALEKRLALADRTLEGFAEDLSSLGWVASTSSPSRTPAVRALGALPRPDLVADLTWDTLPKHVTYSEDGIAALESRYALVDTRDAPVGSLLRVWLSGEFGVKWQLVLERFDAQGRSLGRISTPARNEPRAYFPLELSEPTSYAVLIVTNLSSRLPDADIADENVRSFKLIVDKREP